MVTPEGLDHLCPVIDALPPELTASERDSAIKFICNNAEVISKGEFDLGRSYLIPHRIDTGTIDRLSSRYAVIRAYMNSSLMSKLNRCFGTT